MKEPRQPNSSSRMWRALDGAVRHGRSQGICLPEEVGSTALDNCIGAETTSNCCKARWLRDPTSVRAKLR
eukprot:scaffold279287_cov31-Tisochrysis_lutea.AAC.3